MLCLARQALAVAEQLEVEKSTQQTFTELKNRLETVFNTIASKEAKMVEFENRIRRVDESEDEFMLSLVKIYTAANPDAEAETSKLAIKRKFMNGISAEPRRSIYIFCNEPYEATVTYQGLLEHARKARLQLADQSERMAVAAITNTPNPASTTQENNLLLAINNLEKSVNQRIDSIERKYDQRDEVNAIDNRCGRSNNFRARGNTRGGQRTRFNYSYINSPQCNNMRPQSAPDNDETTRRCYRCGGVNHYARNCLSKN